MRKHLYFIIYLIFTFILLLGNKEQRLVKANFLSSTLYSPFINSVDKIENLFKLQKNYQELSKKLAQKTNEIRDLEVILNKLKTTQTNFDVGKQQFILAQVVGYDGRFLERNLIIDKGRVQGIKPDFPVLHSDGIAGKIISVSLNYAIVLPLTHHSCRLGVMLKRNNLQGILETDIYGKTYMTMIKLGSDIKLDDEVVTSNISSIFPKNYPVGKVIKLIESPNKIFMKAEIKTFVESASLDQVIVLYYEKEKDYEREFQNDQR